MPLAPPLLEHLLDIVRVQVHVHGAVRRVDVADLAVAAHVQGVARKQGEAVLFQARRGGPEFLWGARAKGFEGGAQPVVGGQRAVLVELALRGEAGDVGARAGAVGQAREDAGGGLLGGIAGRGAEGVAEGEEAVPGEAGLAGGRWRGAAGSEFEEVEVVVVD
jgi:hypothetical protein